MTLTTGELSSKSRPGLSRRKFLQLAGTAALAAGAKLATDRLGAPDLTSVTKSELGGDTKNYKNINLKTKSERRAEKIVDESGLLTINFVPPENGNRPWDALEITTIMSHLKIASRAVTKVVGPTRRLSLDIIRQEGNPMGVTQFVDGNLQGKIYTSSIFTAGIAAHELAHAKLNYLFLNLPSVYWEGIAELVRYHAEGFPTAVSYDQLSESLDPQARFHDPKQEASNYLAAGIAWWRWLQKYPDSLKKLVAWADNNIVASGNNPDHEPPKEEEMIHFLDSASGSAFSKFAAENVIFKVKD